MPVRRDPEPPLWRGEWQSPAAGRHTYPPPRRRFDAPRRRCPHCQLVSQTADSCCPVCAAPYFPTLATRLRAWWRGL